MKKTFNNTFLHRTLGISLCFMALSCLCTTNVYAQDESEEDGEVVVKKAARPQNEKVYEMKEVTGVVIDDATGEPMGGVRNILNFFNNRSNIVFITSNNFHKIFT